MKLMEAFSKCELIHHIRDSLPDSGILGPNGHAQPIIDSLVAEDWIAAVNLAATQVLAELQSDIMFQTVEQWPSPSEAMIASAGVNPQLTGLSVSFQRDDGRSFDMAQCRSRPLLKNSSFLSLDAPLNRG